VVETVLDVLNTGYYIYDFCDDPSWGKVDMLVWDVAAIFIPVVPGSYAAKALSKADEVLEGTGKVKSLMMKETRADAIESIDCLPEGLQESAQKFFKDKATNKYKDFSVEEASDGNYMMKMTKPGDVLESKAIYYKNVNPIESIALLVMVKHSFLSTVRPSCGTLTLEVTSRYGFVFSQTHYAITGLGTATSNSTAIGAISFFIDFLEKAKIIDQIFDVMIEAKNKDVALFKLMDELKQIPKVKFISQATINY